MGAYQQSLQCFTEAFSIRRQSFSMAYVTALSTLQNNIAGTYTLLRDMDQALHFFEESHRLEQTSASLSVSVAAKAIFVTLLYNTQY